MPRRAFAAGFASVPPPPERRRRGWCVVVQLWSWDRDVHERVRADAPVATSPGDSQIPKWLSLITLFRITVPFTCTEGRRRR